MNLRPQLTIEEKRQAVYSSLYRYTAEAVHLRQRALQRIVLGALVGSSPAAPFRIGQIERNLIFGSSNQRLRTEVIQDILAQLIEQKKVETTSLLKRHAYCLTEDGNREIGELTSSAEQMFTDVTEHLFRSSAVFLPVNLAEQIFRKFAFECFARFGLQIAKTVTGSLQNDEVIRNIDSRSALLTAVSNHDVTPEQLETLEVKCHQFLISSEPICERLKFYLTQGYYFSQLVGLEQNKFNPLAEQAFSGAVFYLDTNVVLMTLLSIKDHIKQFSEMVNLAKRLGIELRVTRATIDEVQRVISNRIPAIEKIVSKIPDELAERTTDQILLAYQRAHESNPDLTPQQFKEEFGELTLKLKDDLNLIVDDRDSSQIIDGRDTAEIIKVMNEEAVNVRNSGKSNIVLEHDAAHYLLINDERASNPKTWFLTRDRSLMTVAARLQPENTPFAFSHVGFLQSISPFMTTASEEISLADVMSTFVTDQIRPLEALFDIGELSLMADFHSDVMSTPVDQLLMAFDYVKSHTLRGEPYRENAIPKVSVELKKFLTADRDVQIKALQEERIRLAADAESQRKRVQEAQSEINRAFQREEELRGQVDSLQTTLSTTQGEVVEFKKVLEEQKTQAETKEQRRRLRYAVYGVVLSFILLLIIKDLDAYITSRFTSLAASVEYVDWLLRICACLIFVVPAFQFINKSNKTDTWKTLAISIVFIVALAASQIIGKDTLSSFSDLIGVAGQLAVLIATKYFVSKSTSV